MYDLRGDRVSIEVPVVPNAASHGQAMIVATNPGGDAVQIIFENGSLYFQKRVGGSYTDVGSLTYDAVQHRFWALSESSGTLRWETSPDGSTWTVRASAPAPIPLRLLEIDLLGGTYQSEASPGGAQFDNLNGGGTPTGKFCKTSTLKDDFNDGVRADDWSRAYVQGGATRAETGGELVLTPSTSASQAGYVSATAFDLTNDQVAIEVPQILSAATPAYAELELSAGSGRYVEFFVQSGLVKMVEANGGGSVTRASVTYSATDHRWWRLREATGTLYWETSADGHVWTTRFSEADPFALTALDVYLLASTNAAVSTPGSLHYDNYNLLP
jgi:hypothetical protein